MRDIESFAVPAQATFGRDGAMFEGLLDFVAQLSLVLWGLVVLTVVIRFVGVGLYRRGATRRALAAALAPPVLTSVVIAPPALAPEALSPEAPAPGALMPAGLTPGPVAATDTTAQRPQAGLVDVMAADATFRDDLQPAEAPAAVPAPVGVHRRIFRSRRRHLPALASSTEG
ncbi:hypothetical protein Achl_2797 [Pseudarthrobacter chlorophenolicus A6]|uniref:Uncharacterized protein n=1 Tax=Pseudarthrobacter chlorophenolicus (strain ATCC 700700 / DSM 12829 / CIP 107037 / JCM 12360 / KCTC 9906 / NCIMB 13794 / A6) TaxID=452863 RepID=B8HDP4_PSECP|nr:hypothetical protein [Pseudarthrobacter chlorophenolicus]ACL40762.1 hypothetical protein Achl_2797 [Pseudarthrobacter chlorophenolicus A6]SDQ75537.1 hypothetical protein SAMN04489738_2683 [Pseudarthrobacter chlorophenolicus]